jgi:putative flippase GtrA
MLSSLGILPFLWGGMWVVSKVKGWFRYLMAFIVAYIISSLYLFFQNQNWVDQFGQHPRGWSMGLGTLAGTLTAVGNLLGLSLVSQAILGTVGHGIGAWFNNWVIGAVSA